MTMQVQDCFIHKGRIHSLDRASAPRLPTTNVELCAAIDGFTHAIFDPVKEYNLSPNAGSTACWRGNTCEYRIRNGRLVLDAFYLLHSYRYGVKTDPKTVLGVKGVVKKVAHWTHSVDKTTGKRPANATQYDEFFVCYQGLNHSISYHGTIVITPVLWDKAGNRDTKGKDEPRVLSFDQGRLVSDKPATPEQRGKCWGYVNRFYKNHRNLLRPAKEG